MILLLVFVLYCFLTEGQTNDKFSVEQYALSKSTEKVERRNNTYLFTKAISIMINNLYVK